MDKFFTNTLFQKYINNLLANTEVPVLDFVKDGDFIIKDCCYIYYGQIINCTKTGIIGNGASYDVNEIYIPWSKYVKYTNTFINKDGYYTSNVHRQFGNYLRAMNYNEKINLMPMYNCFDYISAENLVVDGDEIKEVVSRDENASNKIFLIPIKFNKEYTLSIESPSKFYIAPVLYSNNRLVDIYMGNSKIDATNVYLKNIQTISHSQFENPILFNVDISSITDDDILKALYDRQNDLYLMIQINYANDSSIVVLEGSYLNRVSIGAEVVSCDDIEEQTFNELYSYMPQLQKYNTRSYSPYSSNLVQYILASAIYNDRENQYNVKYVRQALGLKEKGTYDEEVRKLVFEKAMNSYYTDKTDIYGFVDCNVEKVM